MIAGPAFPDSNPMDATSQPSAGPALGMAADGTYVVAWTSVGASTGVRFKHSGSAAILNASPAAHGVVMAPSVSMAPDGRFVVGWVGTGGNGFVQTYDAAVTPAGSATQVNQTGSLLVGIPAFANLPLLDVAMNGDGNVAAVWGRAEDPFDVLVRRFDATGAPLAAEGVVADVSLGSLYAPAVAASACSDNHVVVWVDATLTVAEFQLYQADDDNNGQPDDCCGP